MPLKKLGTLALIGLLPLAAGCAYDPTFSFPIEQGNVEAGRQAFIDHHCHQCHSGRPDHGALHHRSSGQPECADHAAGAWRAGGR